MNESVYQRAGFADASTRVMTLDGTIFKTAVLLVLLIIQMMVICFVRIITRALHTVSQAHDICSPMSSN